MNVETRQSEVTLLKRSAFNIVFRACIVQMFRVSICDTVFKAFCSRIVLPLPCGAENPSRKDHFYVYVRRYLKWAK